MPELHYSNIPDGPQLVIDASWEAKEETKVLEGFVQGWVQATEIYAKSLSKLIGAHQLKPDGDAKLKTEKTTLAHGHNALTKSVREVATWLMGACSTLRKCGLDFVEFRHSQSKEKRNLQTALAKSEKKLQKYEDSHAVAKKHFEECCVEVEKALIKREKMRTTGRMDFAAKKYDLHIKKLVGKCKFMSETYAGRVLELRKQQEDHLIFTNQCLNRFQECERKRVDESKQLLLKFGSFLGTLYRSAAQEVRRTQKVVELINPADDAMLLAVDSTALRGRKDDKKFNGALYYPYEGKQEALKGLSNSFPHLRSLAVRTQQQQLGQALDVFRNSSARSVFMEFLEKERSKENLAFWEQNSDFVRKCVEYAFLDDSSPEEFEDETLYSEQQMKELREMEMSIYMRFLGKTAKEEVNLSDKLRKTITHRWKELKQTGAIDPTLFLTAAAEAQRIMEDDTMQRFIRTKKYTGLIDDRKMINAILRRMRQPPPIGLHSTYESGKGVLFRQRESFSGTVIVDWITSNNPKLMSRSTAIEIATILLKEDELIPCGSRSAMSGWSESAFYRVRSEELQISYPRNGPFPTRVVNLRDVELTPLDAPHLTWRLLATQRLSTIDLTGKKTLGKRNLLTLLSLLRYVKTLQVLKLSRTECNGPNLVALSDVLLNNPRMQELDLRYNRIGTTCEATPLEKAAEITPTIPEDLACLITAIVELKSLQTVELSHNSLPYSFMDKLVEELEDRGGNSLIVLNVGHNPFNGKEIEDRLQEILKRNQKQQLPNTRSVFQRPVTPDHYSASNSAIISANQRENLLKMWSKRSMFSRTPSPLYGSHRSAGSEKPRVPTAARERSSPTPSFHRAEQMDPSLSADPSFSPPVIENIKSRTHRSSSLPSPSAILTANRFAAADPEAQSHAQINIEDPVPGGRTDSKASDAPSTPRSQWERKGVEQEAVGRDIIKTPPPPPPKGEAGDEAKTNTRAPTAETQIRRKPSVRRADTEPGLLHLMEKAREESDLRRSRRSRVKMKIRHVRTRSPRLPKWPPEDGKIAPPPPSKHRYSASTTPPRVFAALASPNPPMRVTNLRLSSEDPFAPTSGAERNSDP